MNEKLKIKIEEFEGQYTAFIDGNAQVHYEHGIKGCPLGRGSSSTRAIDDLVRRIEVESHVNVRDRLETYILVERLAPQGEFPDGYSGQCEYAPFYDLDEAKEAAEFELRQLVEVAGFQGVSIQVTDAETGNAEYYIVSDGRI